MDPGRTDPSDDQARGYASGGKIMLSAIIILFFVIILMVFLHLYARWYLLRARRQGRRSRNRRAQLVFYVDPLNPNATQAIASRGLDQTVLQALPVFTYSLETHPDLIECAVCLSEFEDKETGRTLPKCNHSFHIECIDMWFHSHSTCPLCRSAVEAPENPVELASSSAIKEFSSSSGLSSTCQHEEAQAGGMSTSSFEGRRKPVELMGVTIEVPRMNGGLEDESGTESPASQAYRSMSRMLSFKRILSRDRRGSPSSCGEAMNELDLERGEEESQRTHG